MPRILDSFPDLDSLSRAQQGPSQTISPGTKGLALGGPPKVLEAVYKPRGWMNSSRGHEYLTKRAEMFQSQTRVWMDYGFKPKGKKD